MLFIVTSLEYAFNVLGFMSMTSSVKLSSTQGSKFPRLDGPESGNPRQAIEKWRWNLFLDTQISCNHFTILNYKVQTWKFSGHFNEKTRLSALLL